MQSLKSTSQSKKNEKHAHFNPLLDAPESSPVWLKVCEVKATSSGVDLRRSDVNSYPLSVSGSVGSPFAEALELSNASGSELCRTPRSIDRAVATMTKRAEGPMSSSMRHDSTGAASSTVVSPEMSSVNAGFLPGQTTGHQETGRLFEIRVDVGLAEEVDPRIAETVFVILKGAGLRQDSQRLWTGAGSDIEEAADSLSDVFLELQSLDVEAKEGLRHIHLTMYEKQRSKASS